MEEKKLFDEKNGIWLVDESNKSFHLFDKNLAEALSSFFIGSTVVDLGCGLGDYVKYFKSRGIICDGYDGNPNTVILTKGECNIIDLSQPINIPKCDYIFSLEVGEHIPKEFEDMLIDNLHKSNKKGMIISWAIEGQSGIGHVNCRNNDYIINKIEKLGYNYDILTSHLLREAATFPYFKNTIMVFDRL